MSKQASERSSSIAARWLWHLCDPKQEVVNGSSGCVEKPSVLSHQRPESLLGWPCFSKPLGRAYFSGRSAAI